MRLGLGGHGADAHARERGDGVVGRGDAGYEALRSAMLRRYERPWWRLVRTADRLRGR